MALPLDIRAEYTIEFTDPTHTTIMFYYANQELNPFLSSNIYKPITLGPLNVSADTFPTVEDAIAYYLPSVSATILADVNTAASGTGFSYFVRDEYTGMNAGTNNQIIKKIATLPTFSPSTPADFTLAVSGTGATGTQVSSTKASQINVTYSTQFTYSLSGNPSSIVTLKICSTNSSTEGDWTEVGRTGSTQQSGLAVTVGQTIQQVGQITSPIIPSGWYVKAVNSGSGTHSEAFVSGQKVIF